MQTPPGALRRKPFTAIRKGLIEHVLTGRLQGTAFGVYIWLHLLANHTRGTVRTNASRIAAELRLHPVTVRRDLVTLRDHGYVRYASARGKRDLYEIEIAKYDRHFEAIAEPGAEQAPLQVPLHERTSSGRRIEQNRSPKNKEVRSTTTLRVRSADVDLDPKSSSNSGERLSREEALAAAPAILRETVELFFLKTGRNGLDAEECSALADLERAHTPAVIQRAITKAVDRLARRGQPPTALTLGYVWESLKRFATRRRTTAFTPVDHEVPPGKYPPGLTLMTLPEDPQ